VKWTFQTEVSQRTPEQLRTELDFLKRHGHSVYFGPVGTKVHHATAWFIEKGCEACGQELIRLGWERVDD